MREPCDGEAELIADSLAKFIGTLGAIALKLLPELLVLGGIAALVYGVSLWSVPKAWVTCGVSVIVLGLAIGFKKS